MTFEELLTLGRMGFSAQQVGQLIAFRQMQPAQSQPQMQQPAQISQPAIPPIQPVQPQILQQPAQIPPAQAPAQVQPWQPQLFQQAAPGSAIFQPQAPAAQPAQADPIAQIMQAIGGVQTTLQAQALAMAQQPKPQTAEDIMASIINPPLPQQPGQVQK